MASMERSEPILGSAIVTDEDTKGPRKALKTETRRAFLLRLT